MTPITFAAVEALGDDEIEELETTIDPDELALLYLEAVRAREASPDDDDIGGATMSLLFGVMLNRSSEDRIAALVALTSAAVTQAELALVAADPLETFIVHNDDVAVADLEALAVAAQRHPSLRDAMSYVWIGGARPEIAEAARRLFPNIEAQ